MQEASSKLQFNRSSHALPEVEPLQVCYNKRLIVNTYWVISIAFWVFVMRLRVTSGPAISCWCSQTWRAGGTKDRWYLTERSQRETCKEYFHKDYSNTQVISKWDIFKKGRASPVINKARISLSLMTVIVSIDSLPIYTSCGLILYMYRTQKVRILGQRTMWLLYKKRSWLSVVWFVQ